MSLKHFLGLLGFFFVAAWIGFSFGDAVLCLLGTGVFYVIGGVLQGDIDLSEVQARVQGQPGGYSGRAR